MIVTVQFLWRPVNYTVAHQRYRQTDRTDRQTERQRSDSIGQTVLQTVSRKSADRRIDVRDSPGFSDDSAASSVASDICRKSFDNSDDDSLSLSSLPLASSSNNSCSSFAPVIRVIALSIMTSLAYDGYPVPSFYLFCC